MAQPTVKNLVADSGAFIKHAELQRIGEVVYTVPEVVAEVRDKATREQLQVLPYDMKFREPTPEAIKMVTEFARKTGDLRSLSAVDIRVIALVYTLEKELVGAEHIRTQPSNKVQWIMPEKQTENVILPGFYVKKNKSATESDGTSVEDGSNCVDALTERLEQTNMTEDSSEVSQLPAAECSVGDNRTDDSEPTVDTSDVAARERLEGETIVSEVDTESAEHDAAAQMTQLDDGDHAVNTDSNSCSNDEDEENVEDSGSEEEDDDEGWITPGNLEAMKQATLAINQKEASSTTVACITTDYAMQNVLIQMGLHVVSVNGMLIRRTQSKILRCYGCFKVMADCEREFCSHCGNKTLSRVTVAYDDDGTVQCFLSKHKKFTTRGLRYSLPRPQGGKYAHNPILCEDQREAQKRTSRMARTKLDVFDDDYLTRSSPFATIDIYSRSAMLGYTGRKTGPGQRRRNPNENRKHYGHRK